MNLTWLFTGAFLTALAAVGWLVYRMLKEAVEHGRAEAEAEQAVEDAEALADRPHTDDDVVKRLRDIAARKRAEDKSNGRIR